MVKMTIRFEVAGRCQFADELEEGPGLLGTFGEEQLLRLIDGKHRARVLARIVVGVGLARGGNEIVDDGADSRRIAHGGADIGAAVAQAGGPAGFLQRAQQARLAGERPALWTHDRQHDEVAIVAPQARHQSGAQERRFAGARGGQDRHQPRRRRFGKAAQPVEGLDGRRLAAVEDAGVLGLQGLEPAIGRPVGLVLRRPGEEARVEARPRQSRLQPGEAGLREGDMRLAAVGQSDAHHAVVGCRRRD